jgi:cytochrome c1
VSNDFFVGILMAVVVIALAGGVLAAYFRMRHPRLVTSPDSGQPAVSESAAVAREAASASDRKAAFRKMAQWYAAKQCAICGRDVAPLSHFGPEPGLMSETSPTATIAWTDVPPEQLPGMLSTYRPVCSSCHLMTRFRHEHPDLVIDRHRTQEADTTVH